MNINKGLKKLTVKGKIFPREQCLRMFRETIFFESPWHNYALHYIEHLCRLDINHEGKCMCECGSESKRMRKHGNNGI